MKLSCSQNTSKKKTDGFNFRVVCSPTGRGCYITINATDPNIAAIRGLASGLVAVAWLGLTAAHFGCCILPSTPVSDVIRVV